jgi:signal transduction histidine kinase
VEFEMVLQDGLWQAKADPSQVEQVIINLILNARDALPDGGKVSIETANVHFGSEYFQEQLPGFFAGRQNIDSGDYVTVVVTDNGTGIPPQDVEHIFEPFFSTKDVGAGTGLGLSMVYGFAQQSDGFVHIDTEMGRGTRMKFGLPRASTEDVKR